MNSLPQIPVSFGCHPKTPPILNSPALLARFFIVVIICGIFPRAPASDSFHFTGLTEESLALFEGDRPVFVYNHGMIHQPGVPADRARSTYVHPLYGLDGEVLTDDFPADHTHHRGLFWAWPHVRVGEQHYDLWMLHGIEQRFERWLSRATDAGGATLGVENGWFVGNRRVVQEQVWIRAAPAGKDERVLDLEFTWIPLIEPLTLEGAEGKSYGGLTLRFAPRAQTVITTPLGQDEKDLSITRLPWADLSARFAGRAKASGAAIFVAPDHPDFPTEWLTRHYGVLCLGWPGVNPKTFQPGETIRCRYRVWIHRGSPDLETVRRAYRAYERAPAWKRETE
ncbi:MAG: PmoA family protein [Verrucomicrobia bacterium]|nr:PmoA family protein [Verrucomicrobiota bacterium]